MAAAAAEASGFAKAREKLHDAAEEIARRTIKEEPYAHEAVRGWTAAICDDILKVAKAEVADYKLIVSAVLLQKNGAGLNTHASAFWDTATDGSLNFTVDTKHVLAVITIFACAL